MKPGRPKLPAISEEMKAWSAALLSELSGWPRVSTRPFFGLRAVYRGTQIFALLPRTRALETASSIAFKLEKPAPRLLRQLENDQRIQTTLMRRTAGSRSNSHPRLICAKPSAGSSAPTKRRDSAKQHALAFPS